MTTGRKEKMDAGLDQLMAAIRDVRAAHEERHGADPAAARFAEALATQFPGQEETVARVLMAMGTFVSGMTADLVKHGTEPGKACRHAVRIAAFAGDILARKAAERPC